MAFRIPGKGPAKAASAAVLFQSLTRDPSIKFLWAHQESILGSYHSQHEDASDIAIELPTGAGKTLIGLLLGEYQRSAKNRRTIFCCPNKQLASQVAAQARKYGITAPLLIGPSKEWPEKDFLQYQQAKAIAITTYSSIFNFKPRISDPDVIICDDAHAAESLVASQWRVEISREDHAEIYEQVRRALAPAISKEMSYAIDAAASSKSFRSVDLLSMINLHECMEAFSSVMDGIEKLESKKKPLDILFPWLAIREHLEACNFYISPSSFEIRPAVPPTLTHPPFARAAQRIYMSATLGEDGDLERIFGIPKIAKLPLPDGWQKRSTGRRLILFPGLSTGEGAELDVVLAALKKSPRSLVLVSDERSRKSMEKRLSSESFGVMGAADIASDLAPFVGSPAPTVLLVANRYDGIDLPGDDCRMMAIHGLPAGTSLQERYLLQKLGASAHLRDRIRTRVTQALGRCTRDETDYSVVLVTGPDLVKWFCTQPNVVGLPPEIQSEVEFGLLNSVDQTPDDIHKLIHSFLEHGEDWREAEEHLRVDRESKTRVKDDVVDVLSECVSDEIEFVYRMWKGDYESALELAQGVVAALEGGKDLRPYRSFWYHEGAEAAFLAAESDDNEAFRLKAIELIDGAVVTSLGLKWLPRLRSKLGGELSVLNDEVLPVKEWYEALDGLLGAWGVRGGKFAKELAQARVEIDADEAKKFEKGLKTLGEMLGAFAHRWPSKDSATPDGLWLFGDWHAFVFECKSDEKPAFISVTAVRQALTHEKRAREDGLLPEDMPCSTIFISHHTAIDVEAAKIAGDIYHVTVEDVRALFSRAARAIERFRAIISKNMSPEDLMEEATDFYAESTVAMREVKALLQQTRAASLPPRKA